MGIRQGRKRDLGHFFSFSFVYSWCLRVGTQFDNRTRLLAQAVQQGTQLHQPLETCLLLLSQRSLRFQETHGSRSRQVRDRLHPNSSELDRPSRQKKALGDVCDEPQMTRQGCGRGKKHNPVSLSADSRDSQHHLF